MSCEGEKGYLHQLRLILEGKDERENRTGVNTFARNGIQLVHNLEFDSIPMLTVRKMDIKNILKELFLFISGSTDANKLSEQGLSIWKDHTTREFLDSRGLTNYAVGDMGPYIPYQWRHYGEKYMGKDEDYTNKGSDRLKTLIKNIRNDPTSRRHTLHCSNPLGKTTYNYYEFNFIYI